MTRQRGGRLETAAILFLTLGWLLPLLGWLVGAVLTGISTVWSTREKLFALPGMFALVLVAWGVPLVLQGAYSTEEQRGFVVSTSWLAVVTVSLMFSGILGGLYLWRRLYVRPTAA
jgi:hypothetical protein